MRMKIQLDIIFEIRHISNVILIVLCDTKNLFVKMRFTAIIAFIIFKATHFISLFMTTFCMIVHFFQKTSSFLDLEFLHYSNFLRDVWDPRIYGTFWHVFQPKNFFGQNWKYLWIYPPNSLCVKTIATLHVHHKKIWWIFDRSENLKLCKIP